MRHADIHSCTTVELERLRSEVAAEIALLRELIHDLGPSVQRDALLTDRRGFLEAIDRELGHRARED